MSDTALDAGRCWDAVVGREANGTGSFFYGVMTTGIFCRPGCSSRLPRRENVRFYQTTERALADGLRPCKRCQPLSRADGDDTIEMVCRAIEERASGRLTLAELGRMAGFSPTHLQRRFKAAMGVTPRQYHEAARLRSLKSLLREEGEEGSVTGAIYEAGYGSLSRIYERTGTALGMTPMAYRDGGRGVEITFTKVDTSLGVLLVGGTERGLCFAQFGDDEGSLFAALQAEFPNAAIEHVRRPSGTFGTWVDSLARMVEGRASCAPPPVHARATAFQALVWDHLRMIPAGATRSYGEVASNIGHPGASRAVARACASNMVAVAVPCHRVVRRDGEPGGYRWGPERKQELLRRERAAARESQGASAMMPSRPRSGSVPVHSGRAWKKRSSP